MLIFHHHSVINYLPLIIFNFIKYFIRLIYSIFAFSSTIAFILQLYKMLAFAEFNHLNLLKKFMMRVIFKFSFIYSMEITYHRFIANYMSYYLLATSYYCLSSFV